MKKSHIADNIMREYRNKKRYESNKEWSEIQRFKKQNCMDCENKNTNLCEISRTINGNLQCVYKKKKILKY